MVINGFANTLVNYASYTPSVSSVFIYQSHMSNIVQVSNTMGMRQYFCVGNFNLPNIRWLPTDEHFYLISVNVGSEAELTIDILKS